MGPKHVTYKYAPQVATEELFALYYALASHGIGPQVLYATENSISVARVDLLVKDFEDMSLNPKLIKWLKMNKYDPEEVVLAAIKATMNILHDVIGYCHADAHPGNMGFITNGTEITILLFDLDRAFPISIGKYMPSVLQWIDEAYDDRFLENRNIQNCMFKNTAIKKCSKSKVEVMTCSGSIMRSWQNCSLV